MQKLLFLFLIFNTKIYSSTNYNEKEIFRNIKINCHNETIVKHCEYRINNKLMRTITYENNEITNSTIYYKSGNVAKKINFIGGKIYSLSIYFDEKILETDPALDESNLKADLYFNNGNLEFLKEARHYHLGVMGEKGVLKCLSTFGNVCNEEKIFLYKSDNNLHSALTIPLADNKLDVYTINGINHHYILQNTRYIDNNEFYNFKF